MDYLLSNLRVVDFGWAAAGPILGLVLADMGAEVIKVESRKHIDTSRVTPDNLEKDLEKDPWFHSLNRNKLGVTVDMSQPEGLDLLRSLIKISDVVIENFYPGVMNRFGLDYDPLSKENPRLVMVSLPGMGSWGPEAGTPTYAPSIAALSGIDSLVGYPGERVLGTQQPIPDVNAGILGAFAVLAALVHRDKAGEGQHIELAQIEGVGGCLGEALMEHIIGGRTMGISGNHSRVMAPHNNFPCRGDDQWVSIAIKTEEEWQHFCQAIDHIELANDGRFSDMHNRLANQDELDRIVAEWTNERSGYEVMEILQGAGVAAVPCIGGQERFLDPHFQERKVFTFFPHPATESTLIPGSPWKMSETKCPIYRPAPMLGQHNQYVFGDLLGFSKEQIEAMEERKVLY